ncbi:MULTISPECIES: hypothetical protein [unclassified Microbacterium]|uniref:hypothetical protein n=1 Tax=unclassified Microbacterium TaxID=2609290 RepID=UPI000C2B5A4C|nr:MULTISPECIES: hypothetical protein [unclassified Microbacterium]
MTDDHDAADHDATRKQFEALLSLHKYFLNADFQRDVFMKRVTRERSPGEVDFVTALDDQIAMSFWYATVYIVIEGWRKAGLADSDVDLLLSDDRVDRLRRFRNQVFHYQREYDNPRLLEFLGTGDDDAQAATQWIRRIHIALGRSIRQALQEMLDEQRAGA